ncbi:hypothetical protein HLB23_11880 [Nocardia uniformis]|uniref:Uncharacterized protein n=1 Tax=Nocardia uniformis TaxID=53432 RepID=A0A849CC53_9NOCA|nr:hypothetical protein [Nocardia uniformis]NNH70551.1 hypothetical protein [Nocardia uniformis]
MSRTTIIIIIGFVLLGLFLLCGSLFGRRGMHRAAEDFLLVWLALVIGNMAVGVIDEGYGVAEEIPFLLINFIPPGIVAAVAWFRTRPSLRQPQNRS